MQRRPCPLLNLRPTTSTLIERSGSFGINSFYLCFTASPPNCVKTVIAMGNICTCLEEVTFSYHLSPPRPCPLWWIYLWTDVQVIFSNVITMEFTWLSNTKRQWELRRDSFHLQMFPGWSEITWFKV